jgi:hypothetical protein
VESLVVSLEGRVELFLTVLPGLHTPRRRQTVISEVGEPLAPSIDASVSPRRPEPMAIGNLNAGQKLNAVSTTPCALEGLLPFCPDP